jgi:site-specific DNA recombinase
MTSKPFIRYVRVSRVGGREGEGYISIPEQLRTCDQKAREHSAGVHEDVFRDEDRSGGNLDRPEFQRALGLIRNGEAGGIIVATLDRFSRDVADALVTIREVEKLGGRLYCGDGDVTLQNGSDEFTATVRLAAAAFDRARKREYLDNSVRSAIERGVHLSAPFGYVKSNGKGSRLAVNPVEAPTVLRMFEMRARGCSWTVIANATNAAGVLPRPSKRDGVVRHARWTAQTVKQIVHSETYMGVAHNGTRRHEGAHDAIVTAELFHAANHARGVKPAGPADGYLLTGLGRCSLCGYALIHQGQGERRYYRCQHDGCRALSVPAGPIEQHVADAFALDFLDVEMVATATDDHVIGAESAVTAARARLAGLFEMAGGLGEMSASEREMFDGQLRGARACLRDAEASLRAAHQASHGAELPIDLDAAGFEALSVPERRRLLGLVYAAAVVRPAAVWREPVAQRVRMLGRHEAPADSTHLIAFVAGLDR